MSCIPTDREKPQHPPQLNAQALGLFQFGPAGTPEARPADRISRIGSNTDQFLLPARSDRSAPHADRELPCGYAAPAGVDLTPECRR